MRWVASTQRRNFLQCFYRTRSHRRTKFLGQTLGDIVTAWMMAHRELTIVEVTVRQSSDAAFHCVTIVVWYREHETAR